MQSFKSIVKKSYILLYLLMVFTGIIICASNLQAGTLYTVREDNNTLVSIDTDTLAYNVIGPLGVSFDFGGLAYDPNSQTLYMIGGSGSNNLYTVDRTTGQATLIGSHGISSLFGLAFDSTNNVLYATQFSGTSLYSLNTSNGTATLIGNMGTSNIGGLAYNSATDTLIGVRDGYGTLYSINRTNANLSLVFNGPWTNDSGLEYDPDKNFYWDIDWSGNLISYDIANSYATTTRLSGLGSHDGLAYLSSGPNPTAVPTMTEWGMIIFITLAGLGSVYYLRRQKRANS